MTPTIRGAWTAAIALPLALLAAYLLWIWPRPAGDSPIAQLAPYVLSLVSGVPFVLWIARRSGHAWIPLLYVAGGFVVLWLVALAVLCGVRGVCL